tara:strand:+ start:2707 stop:4824 length:2118 start_codon:yes stop_codon:yes gene_type:complete
MKPEEVSPSLAMNPEMDTWLRINSDGTVTAFTGKVEIGQNIRKALTRIVAEELEVPLEIVQLETADTSFGPEELVTAGSLSVEHSGQALRLVSAEAKGLLLEMAAETLSVHIDNLTVNDGKILAGNSSPSTSYWVLMGGKRFQRKISGRYPLKDPQKYRFIGKRGNGSDILRKIRGGEFIQDFRLPDMLFGRVVKPPFWNAKLLDAKLENVDQMHGVVKIIRDGSFLGIVAQTEDAADRARSALVNSIRWSKPCSEIEDPGNPAYMKREPHIAQPIVEGMPEDRIPEPVVTPSNHTINLEAEYSRPFVMHASIGPSAAVACQEPDFLRIWTHSQGIGPSRKALASALDIEEEKVRLTHVPGAGCYGHNGADDAAYDAALLAREVPGLPIHLQWTREDENIAEPYGPAMVVSMKASSNTDGTIVNWSHDVLSYTHVTRPLPPLIKGNQFSSAWIRKNPAQRPTVKPLMRSEIGEHRNAWPAYKIEKIDVTRRLITTQSVRTSALRSLGAYANIFAIESFMDEMAEANNCDPLTFRLKHLSDPRAHAVLERVVECFEDPQKIGIAYARYENCRAYAAVGVRLDIDSLGKVHLEQVEIAIDAGQIIDPSGLIHQAEGGFIQSASWTLHEAVRFENGQTSSRDWDSYPIMTFSEIPDINTHLIDHPELPPLGAGEATQGPTPAAIANAIYKKTGRRLRKTPFSPDNLRS